MKTNELQIGDIITVWGVIRKVEALTKKSVGFHVKENEVRINYASIGATMPIPITPSIIEKNEFHLDERCLKFDVYRWKSLDGRIEIIKREDGTWSVHIDDEHYQTLGGFYCRYVHELQHALRLCGIDKEIQI